MAFQPVELRGRILPNYATIERDDRIPFWRELGKRVHEYDCKFIRQLSHAGRQRDIGGIEYEKGLSATDKPDPLSRLLPGAPGASAKRPEASRPCCWGICPHGRLAPASSVGLCPNRRSLPADRLLPNRFNPQEKAGRNSLESKMRALIS